MTETRSASAEGTSVDVTVLVPVLDEGAYIRDAAAAMRAQHFTGTVEFLFIDGGSKDGTGQILEEIAREDSRVRLLDNPARRTPNALNVGLRNARGKYVARMDAHTYYPAEYIEAGVRRLRQGGIDWVSGPQLAFGTDRWSRLIALALSTVLGTGGARSRRAMQQEIEVDTGFTGIWRRSTLEAMGGWDEGWPNDQDFELAARIRKAGGRIACIPEMAAQYVPRNSLRALARQYARYGFYRVKTSRRHPESMRRSHVLPPALTLTLLGAAVGPAPLRKLARLGLAVYGLAILGTSATAARVATPAEAASLPAVFAVMHLSYGAGFFIGSLRFGPPLAALAHVAGIRQSVAGAADDRSQATTDS
jgi:succinoglycan biosynthesis protein ExoA